MSLETVRVGDVAKRLDQPFVMRPIAQIDHFAAYLYLCTGFVARHRHISQDEMFYVYEGLLSFETDWGRAILSNDELTVIPGGMSHLSGSLIRTIVMRFAAQSDPDRKNGHGRLTVEDGLDTLPKWSVERHMRLALENYLPFPLAQADEMSLRLVRCGGDTPWHRHPHHGEMLWVRRGAIEIGTEHSPVKLRRDELTVIPAGLVHRLSAEEPAWALSLIHGEVSREAHMGLAGQTGLA